MGFFDKFFDALLGKGAPAVPQNRPAQPSRPVNTGTLGREHDAIMASKTPAADPVLKGYTFCATLQITIPLKYLLMDGTKRDTHIKMPPEEMRYGIWIPEAFSWRDMGVDLDEMLETDSASDVGPVRKSDYLPFLIEVRTAVESSEPLVGRVGALKEVLKYPSHAKFVRKLGGQGAIVDLLFPRILASVPGVNLTVAEALKVARIKTVAQLRKKTDQDLLALKGVGPGALAKLRDFSANFTGDETAERIDAPVQ